MSSARQQATYPDLAGRVAFVTGGSGALGAVTCRSLAKNGVRVAVSGRRQSALDRVVRTIATEGGVAIACPADCTNGDALESARERATAELGPIDILVAFAGGGGEPFPFTMLTEEKWRAVVDANLTATFLTIRTFSPAMLESKRGAIVTMASSAGRLPGLAAVPYAAAKAGIVMLTGHLAREFAANGVRINCIAPSSIKNERMANLPAEKLAEIASSFPLGRIGVPADVANAALFLASESASWITGVTLDIAGGRIIA